MWIPVGVGPRSIIRKIWLRNPESRFTVLCLQYAHSSLLICRTVFRIQPFTHPYFFPSHDRKQRALWYGNLTTQKWSTKNLVSSRMGPSGSELPVHAYYFRKFPKISFVKVILLEKFRYRPVFPTNRPDEGVCPAILTRLAEPWLTGHTGAPCATVSKAKVRASRSSRSSGQSPKSSWTGQSFTSSHWIMRPQIVLLSCELDPLIESSK